MAKREYIPNAWLSLGDTYHVAQRHPEASDENPGTEALPFKTISAAARVVRDYDRVVIDEGVYREQVALVREGLRNLPSSWTVFAAAPGKQVYLKGSDVFNPDWQETGPGVFRAELPQPLFKKGAYNPYELPCTPSSCPANYEYDRGGYDPREPDDRMAGPEKVRPTAGPTLPETLGQIYVDDEPLRQLDSVAAVRETPGSFVVSADGKEIICHFAEERVPDGKRVELTVRQRCFKPEFKVHWSGLHIRTLGIVAEHAAAPGAFSRCRPLSIRRNPRTGITTRKTFHAYSSVCGAWVSRSNLSYLSKNDPAVLCTVRDGSRPFRPSDPDAPGMTVVSRDGAKTWEKVETGPLTDPVANYFLDEENGMLVRHYRARADGEIYNDKAEAPHGEQKLVMQVSPDGGQTWGAAEALEFADDIVCFTLMKLQNGKLFWIIEENKPELSPLWGIKPDPLFFTCRTWLGTWRADRSGIDWERGGLSQVAPEMGAQGVGEPQACQLRDGRVFVVFRQCPTQPTQDSPGFPSVKLFAVSEDNGRTWSEPKPLTFDDGKYLYSSVSFASAVCSLKNGRLYVILNILNRPVPSGLPRNVLHVAEVDQETFSVKRDTVTVVEEIHEEHTHLSGYSNWSMMEDRYTKNLLLFMNMESGPVYDGYDWNYYRYEIEFPA